MTRWDTGLSTDRDRWHGGSRDEAADRLRRVNAGVLRFEETAVGELGRTGELADVRARELASLRTCDLRTCDLRTCELAACEQLVTMRTCERECECDWARTPMGRGARRKPQAQRWRRVGGKGLLRGVRRESCLKI